jgi:hypothetical protein
VKPVNTDELLRQLEALLITHQDQKMAPKNIKKAPVTAAKAGRHAAGKPAE